MTRRGKFMRVRLLATLFLLSLAWASPAFAGSSQFSDHCLLCHGPDARGVEGLGVSLVDSAYVAERSVAELVAFLKAGRLPDDPDSVSSRPMPGFAWVEEADLVAIAEHVKSLNRR